MQDNQVTLETILLEEMSTIRQDYFELECVAPF